jgi:diguanylate cyclase (GGDEF)-like protein
MAGIAMKRGAAGSQRRTVAVRPHPRPTKPLRTRVDQERRDETPKPPKPPKARSVAMRLAAEVERLAAQLEQSHARVAALEAKIDVDPLTGLLNRRGFERELIRSIAYVKRYGTSAALVYLDLDGFKPVNDRHGHAAGDAMLKAIAAALRRRVRASDVVARWGGDEFVVLLWNVSGPAAAVKAGALERAIHATPVRWRSSTLVVGAAAGVALIGALDSPAEALGRADAAMYARKRARNGGAHRQDAALKQ